tara:strand:- start:11152 stop:12102 length:951 start_codon:yes stop_codon:yes gene_type:complete
MLDLVTPTLNQLKYIDFVDQTKPRRWIIPIPALNHRRHHRSTITSLLLMSLLLVGGHASAQLPATPKIGQEGKDVPWVPTPDVLVDKMLEMAAVTPDDVVIDLGSGDGRTVIAAAQLGARAIGVELEENLVTLSRQRAEEAGVSSLTEFYATDLFEFDLSPATVITMFLLPDINYQLRPHLLELTPGTRIVSNTWDLSGAEGNFEAPGWLPDETVVIDPCPTWCTSLLWVVPAKVEGTWQLGEQEMELQQQFQRFTGQLRYEGRLLAIEQGRIHGTELSFQLNNRRYTGSVEEQTMSGFASTPDGDSENWQATRRN